MNQNEPRKNTNTAPAGDQAGNPFADMPVIFSYTRAQALEDGVLVDLTEWARETGFRIPVACTADVWHRYVTPPHGTRELGQSERGRAHDVLWMLFVAIKRHSAHRRAEGSGQARGIDNGRADDAGRCDDRLMYEVIFLQAPNRHETVQLKSICGPGDHGEPVLTILLPHED